MEYFKISFWINIPNLIINHNGSYHVIEKDNKLTTSEKLQNILHVTTLSGAIYIKVNI